MLKMQKKKMQNNAKNVKKITKMLKNYTNAKKCQKKNWYGLWHNGY